MMYYCNVTLGFDSIETESVMLCDFVNYHIIMLAFFGTISILLMFTILGLFACYGYNQNTPTTYSIQISGLLMFATFLLSMGIDGALIILYLVSILIIFYTFVQSCINSLAPHFEIYRTRRLDTTSVLDSINVTDGVEMRQSMEHFINDTLNKVISNCSICLETDEGPWFVTACGHMFHPTCIQKWQKDTCPLCRTIFKVNAV
jgi:hypothetical protein